MKESTMNAETVQHGLELIQESAEKNAYQKPRKVETMSIGDYGRQGDIYYTYLGPDNSLVKAELTKGILQVNSDQGSQVFPGTTRGSRHCIANIDECKVYEMKGANALQGPIIEAPTGFTLTHGDQKNKKKDDHATHEVKQEGWYCFTAQRQFDLEEIRRIAD